MIRHLTLKDVGPARELKFDFSPRLNVLTGDNGLGKTFVLDVLWWVLTTTWAGEVAFPWRPAESAGAGDEGDVGRTGEAADPWDRDEDGPSIETVLGGRFDEDEDSEIGMNLKWLWGRARQQWVRPPDSPVGAGRERSTADLEAEFRPKSLVIYARIDGSFAIWDSYYAKGDTHSFAEAAVILPQVEVWDGKEVAAAEMKGGGRRTVIRGLLADWANWQQRAKSPEFESLRRVLAALGSPEEPLIPGEPTRVRLDDRRDIPTLTTSYGTVPVTLASAGVRRALSLAYLLVWAWTEHMKAAEQTGRKPTRDVVVLIDEPELHLHPSWQRTFLPAVLEAVGLIAPNAAVQVVSATHSPLVLASLEPLFDAERDALFTFDVMPRARRVKVEKSKWRARGDVSNWLTSDVFDLGYARSLDAEQALVEALKALDDPNLTDARAQEVHRHLHRTLGDTDPFWSRWVEVARSKGIEP